MSTVRANGKAAKPPVEALIRGETADERLTMIAIQTDHTMNLVEGIAGVLMSLGRALADEERKAPKDCPLPVHAWKAFARLDEAMAGGPQ